MPCNVPVKVTSSVTVTLEIAVPPIVVRSTAASAVPTVTASAPVLVLLIVSPATTFAAAVIVKPSPTVTTAPSRVPVKVPLPSNAAVVVPLTESTLARSAFNVECRAVTTMLPVPAAVTVFPAACAADKLSVTPLLTEIVSWPDIDTFDMLTVFAAVMVLVAALIVMGKSAVLSGSVVAALSVSVTFAKFCADKLPPAVTAATPVPVSAIAVPALLNADACDALSVNVTPSAIVRLLTFEKATPVTLALEVAVILKPFASIAFGMFAVDVGVFVTSPFKMSFVTADRSPRADRSPLATSVELTLISFVTAALVLPALSVWVTVMISSPSPKLSPASLAATVNDQVPLSETVTVLLLASPSASASVVSE